jgi:DNA polymerase sigma
MTAKVSSTLQQYEEMVSNGKIATFAVRIQENSLLIKPSDSDTGQEFRLIEELQSALRTFFYEVESIEYGSFDYATLKSLINARECLDRMTKKQDNSGAVNNLL